MLILGDIATFKEKITFRNCPKEVALLLNCEGFLTNNISNSSSVVFNNVKFYINLSKEFDLIMNLSNNHTMDIDNGISQSLKFAYNNNLKCVGGGNNLSMACRAYRFKEKNTNVSILSAGWDIIGCKPATAHKEGVAPIDSRRLIKQVQEEKALGNKVVVYFHWDYELEIYPHPTHRKLAKKLIDCGADIILGCHSHCLQGFEIYKEKFIFYGLGNTIFDENYYFNSKLKFPDFCKLGLAIDWDPNTDKVRVSHTNYINDELVFSHFISPEESQKLMSLSTFAHLDDSQYIDFFMKNRRKKKFLPIFHEEDTTLTYHLKRWFLLFRAVLIKKMFTLGLKGHSR
ncbi:TPA: CapA family protein [Acinetobacter baumannii]|uniref:CapA family protein n=1 Tax=Acinetobacter baumannii TaxID=470 RepID=UPI0010C81C3D|nr:CapA family protein [Acinetobacter baumannii]MDC4781640.1 CapA family protein [Acinetobacter baumannii]MDC4804210.1 CapA family protein [Acinetobacter baumannii]QCP37538.1 CapA family protein [Acinetobacter baumannii]HCW4112131.1 CapA family protein [Acinetobacter baumannii]